MSIIQIVLVTLLGTVGVRAQQAELPTTRISYGDEATSFGELRVPDGGGPFPVAVLVHGGCWRSSWGSIEDMRPIATMLLGHGIASWNVEYRRVGHRGGGWPGSFRDLSDAVDHLSVIAESHPIDTSRIVAVGHSSGGYFAAWLAARTRLPKGTVLTSAQPLRVAGVVATDAFLNPLVVDSTGVDGKLYCGEPILERLVGGDPAIETEQLRQVSPLELLPWGVPQEYVVSSKRYPVSPSRPLADGRTTMRVPDYPALAVAAGDEISVQVISDAGHFDFLDPASEAGSAVGRALLQAFESVGR